MKGKTEFLTVNQSNSYKKRMKNQEFREVTMRNHKELILILKENDERVEFVLDETR